MQRVSKVFSALPLPYKYVYVPGPNDPPAQREKKLRLFVNKVITKLTLDAFNHCGFRRFEDENLFNASWGRQFTFPVYSKCKSWQKINHFCGAYLMGRKDNFHDRMIELKNRVKDDASFYPESYLLPRDKEALSSSWQKYPKWISKPSASSRGKGIRMFTSEEVLPNGENVVQMYIEHPLLITGRKFDIRLYVLIPTISPLKVYIHDSGLGRFATHPYDEDGAINDMNMHLTNFSLNKSDRNFIRGTDGEDSVENSKWSLPFLMDYFRSQKIDTDQLTKEFNHVVISTIIAGICSIREEHQKAIKTHHTSYELYGFDVILDENLKPYIIEVNISPAMSGLDSKLDYVIKWRLMLELLNMARIIDCDATLENPCPAINIIEQRMVDSISEARLKQVEGEKNFDPWSNPVFADFVYIRDFVEEYERRKGFTLIYPLKETMHRYFPAFNKMTYQDIVLTKWVEKSEKDQITILKKFWKVYQDGIKDLDVV